MFDVWPTPIGSEDIEELRGDIHSAVKQKTRELKSQGCAAANYRLSGDDVEHLCIVVLPRKHRMVIAFPAEDEVTILLVGPHEEADPEVNVYTRLYEALDIDVPTDKRRKPACCGDDGEPPVDVDLVDNFLDGSKKLRLGRARGKRRGGRGR